MRRSLHFNKLTGLLLLLTLTLLAACTPKTEQESEITTQVERGEFVITVTATGELQAKRSVKIRAPNGMRPAGIYETTLSDLIPEGTVVKAGAYVAKLDRTEIAGKMSNVQTELEKIQTQLEQAKIDTAIELRALRDQLVNLEFTKKEKQLKVEQSKYEPQSVIQTAQLDMERTERDYSQLLKKYELVKIQSEAKIEEIMALMRQNQRQLKIYSDLSNEFTIMAPKDGMVIYARSWNGKIEPGSRISAWDPVVAELPDLTDMISKTYVNEVDISKVRVGQDVSIQVDAFPDHSYTGNVLKVANIGEELRGFDTKVFEIVVQVNEVDSIMRPAMTTSNEIVTDTYEDVLFIPLEALQSDSLSFVYKETGSSLIKQEVITGLSNADQVMIDYGLEAGDVVYLNVPQKGKDATWSYIAPTVKTEIKQKQEEEKRKRAAQAMERQQKMKDVAPPTPDSGGDGGMIIIMD
ncbi:MAG: efflux RND transporter periplasmic adaptor subunit [Saprospiraceae bacterium]